MPAGSSFISDPYIVEGMSVSRFTSSKELQKAESCIFNYRPENILQKYDSNAIQPSTPIKTEQELANLLQ
jgi:hypothetical protein